MTLGALAGEHIYTLYTHKVGCTIVSGPEAEMVHEKQVKLEVHKKEKQRENKVGKEEAVLWIEEQSWVNGWFIRTG